MNMRMIDVRRAVVAIAMALAVASPGTARAEPVKVLTAGAFKQVLLAIAPQFKAAGYSIELDNDTVGALVKRIEGGERFDVVIASPAALVGLAKSVWVATGGVELAKVGIGVAVREGAPKPDIGTVDAFKRTLLAARAVAYIDPAAGGSSGIYVSGLLDRLGIADKVKPKAVLVHGGAAADRVASGDADVVVHQISEILPVKGVVLVGPLPAEIQNYTVYAAGIAADSRQVAAARVLINLLRSPDGASVIKSKGMEPVDPDPPK
jgi:molybdate transport system substrate-binding protein